MGHACFIKQNLQSIEIYRVLHMAQKLSKSFEIFMVFESDLFHNGIMLLCKHFNKFEHVLYYGVMAGQKDTMTKMILI